MVWYLELLLLGLAILFFFSTGLPVAFAFAIINILGLYFLCGGEIMLNLLATSSYASVATFPMVAIPLFILMGGTLTHTGTIELSFNAVHKWLQRLPGNLAIISIASQPCSVPYLGQVWRHVRPWGPS
jgi:TRAP-type mannitol/chloroaromatic compound transport system permease large subunit